MKFSAERIRSRFLNSLTDAAILSGSVLFSVAVGFLIAAPLWALATSSPVIYSRICFAGILILFFLLWIRKVIFLKKKKGISPIRRILFLLCRTLTFFMAVFLVLSVYWQMPVAAVLCGIFLLLLRIPLFLAGDTL